MVSPIEGDDHMNGVRVTHIPMKGEPVNGANPRVVSWRYGQVELYGARVRVVDITRNRLEVRVGDLEAGELGRGGAST